MTDLPWSELVPMLSINPAAATVGDIARLASELMAANRALDMRDRHVGGMIVDIGHPEHGLKRTTIREFIKENLRIGRNRP